MPGDLVNKGGIDHENGKSELETAKLFLVRLANILDIREEQVYVVPGNHDVDWSPGLSQPDRFRKFLDATMEFSRPQYDGANPVPLFKQLHNLRRDVDVEFLLFIPPNFFKKIFRFVVLCPCKSSFGSLE